MNKRDKIQEELIEDYNIGTSGIYELSPRIGKTRLAINIIKKTKATSVLWITPNTKLKEEDIPQEFTKWKAKNYLKVTQIETYAMLAKLSGNYDIVFLDEIQYITEANVLPFLTGAIKAKCIIGLTGTMPKDTIKLDIIHRQLSLKILHSITIDEAVDEEFIADYEINVVECNLDSTNKNIQAGSKAKKFMTTEAAQYDYLNKAVNKALFSTNEKLKQFAILNRMRAIYNSKTKENIAKKLITTLKGRKLVFAGSIEQAEKLSQHTYHSQTTNQHLNLFLNGKIDLLSCVNAGGTGFTYKNVDHFIIVQANSNKTGSVTQKISRALLLQNNYKAQIWIICLLSTKDEDWVSKALEDFDHNKINYINVKNLK